MKVTKRQLKNIIKEELEATMAEPGGGDMAAAQQLAKTLSRDPTIMDAVEAAAQEPEVQQKAEELSQGMDETVKTGASQAMGSVGAGVGGVSGGLMVMNSLGMIGAGVAPLAALGLATGGGLLVAAIGILLYNSIQSQTGGVYSRDSRQIG